MSDTPHSSPRDPQRPLSEIGHLFLSSIRDRQTNGAPRPVRKGPGQPIVPSANIDPKLSIDLTPEEFAQTYGDTDAAAGERRPQVAAVIAMHLNGRQIDRTHEYASHLASTHGRVGLIEVDASEFRLTLFERDIEGAEKPSDAATAAQPEPFDARRMTEALEELSWDVDRWLLLMPTPRIPQCRELLDQVQQWTMLATCDHDGVVSCYRTLKGLLGDKKYGDARPQMSLALLDVRSLDEADRVTLKLTGVCDQFLHSKLESEAVVKSSPQVSSHLVLCCRATNETIGMPQFDVVHQFINQASTTAAPETASVETVEPTMSEPAKPQVNTQNAFATSATDALPPVSDVIDLIGDEATPTTVAVAFIKGSNNLIETPIKAPTCPSASLAVSRDRKLVLVAVAQEGLSDLHAIGGAYRWLCDNRPLISMALPQFGIEPSAPPRLQLLVDQADLRADVLQPMLKGDGVSVQTYRKLRWGGKTGLLLEAA